MDTEQLFYTQNGYDRADTGPLTTAMEDYLEMICRLTRSGGYTRISALARELHVQPSSASKMAALLRSGGSLTNAVRLPAPDGKGLSGGRIPFIPARRAQPPAAPHQRQRG